MVTPITTLWVVGGWGQSGAVFLVSIFNHHCIQFFLGLSPCGPISYKERQHSVENPLITYLLFPVLITEPDRMWVFSLFFSKVCVCSNSKKCHVSVSLVYAIAHAVKTSSRQQISRTKYKLYSGFMHVSHS